MIVDHYTYRVDGSRERIVYGRGLYEGFYVSSTEPTNRRTIYVPDQMLKKYTEEKIPDMYKFFIEHLKEKSHLFGTQYYGVIVLCYEGAFIRCFDNGNMVGFLHIPEKMKDDLKDRLTAKFIANVANEIFDENAYFGLYYCGRLCRPEAKLAEFYYNYHCLEIRVKKVEETAEDQSLERKNKELRRFFRMTEQSLKISQNSVQMWKQAYDKQQTVLEECQESLQVMMKNNDDKDEKINKLVARESTLLKMVNELICEKVQQPKEKVNKVEEQQLEEEKVGPLMEMENMKDIQQLKDDVKKIKEQQQMMMSDESTA